MNIDFRSELARLQDQDLYRLRFALDSAQGPEVIIDGRKELNFCSNDYLGLANDQRLIQTMQKAVELYGIGSGASPMVCGRSRAHADLEELLAKKTGRDRALLFVSGYQANLALINAICRGRDDLVVADKLSHASIIDGAILSPARLRRYQHTDVVSLSRIVTEQPGQRKLVFTDSVFSMDGDIAPLSDIAKECNRLNTLLAVDDAHGFGVLGRTGLGGLEYFALKQEDVPIMMATFGKALGVSGAFVAGREDIIETLVQYARPYIYSTAMPPALAVTITQSLVLMEAENWRREKINHLIKRFKNGARQLDLPLKESFTPIQPLMAGDAGRAVRLSKLLLEQNILVTAIRPPTVPENTARLRITITAKHTEGQIDRLLSAIASCMRALPNE